MNVGFTVGAEIADYFRKNKPDGMEILGFEMTTYLHHRHWVPDQHPRPHRHFAHARRREMTENGMVIKGADTLSGDALAHELKATVAERRSKMWSEFWRSIIATVIIGGIVIACYSVDLISLKLGVVKVGAYLWSFVITAAILAIGGIFYAVSSQIGTMNPGAAFDRVMKSVRDATEETTRQLQENFTAKPFWIYMAMLGILTFVKLAFYIFHVMFPTYATRVFGYDFQS